MLKRERGTAYDCLWFLDDLLPFHFTESGIENTTVVSQGTLEYSIPCEDVEEGTVRVEEEWYEKTMLLALDEGDTTTTKETALVLLKKKMKMCVGRMECQPESRQGLENRSRTTTSYLLKFSCHGQRHFKARIRVGNKKFVANYDKHDLTLQTIHTRKSGWKGS